MTAIGHADEGEYREYLSDISKRLTGAIYRVTDFLSDKDPLKWTLRERALHIHTHVLSIAYQSTIIADIVNNLSVIIALLDIGSSGTYISNRNFDILGREYKKFKDAIESKKDDMTTDDQLIFSDIEQLLEPTPKGQVDVIKDTIDVMADTKQSQLGRKARILEILKGSGEQTVAEIASSFDVSEKSIQRDLLALAEQKRVMAHGEKRWRTYSIS